MTYAFRTATADGRATFFPAANQTAPYRYDVTGVDLPRGEAGALVVNEVMPSNTSIVVDDAGEYEDWVELYNRGTAPIDLSAYTLSDDPYDPFAFRLPARVLQPREHAVIWCDGDGSQGPDHAPFRLDKDGDSVVLSDATSIVDSVDTGVVRRTSASAGGRTARTRGTCADGPRPAGRTHAQERWPSRHGPSLPWGGR
ncbi:MAG: lamin tail domain-containing protein [Ardenticatenales bacterium]|nr:lamin tail domain-containing protein [Ardenticatenales bacterium]